MKGIGFLIVVATIAIRAFAAPPYKDRTVASVLEELRASGLNIVYSTSVVRPDMRVVSEPRATGGRALLEEVIAPHRLRVETGPGGRLLVVPAEEKKRNSVSGTVRDERDGKPLRGATVVISARKVSSGDDGTFGVDTLEPGTHQVRVMKSGYVVYAQSLQVGLEPVVMDVELVAAPVTLEEIVVTPSQLSLFSSDPEQRQFLSREDVARIPHMADDLFRAIGRLPGTASGDISAKFNVRGGEDDEILVLLDGLELDEPFHLKDFQSLFGVVDSEVIGGVDFMRGGFPAQYGDRMSAVLELSSASATEPRRTAVGVSLLNTLFLSQGTFTNGEWLVAGRRGYLDLVLNLVYQDINVFPRYHDIFGKVQWNLGQKHVLSVDALSARDDFVFDEENELMSAAYGGDSLWLNLRSSWSPRWYSQSVVYASQGDRSRKGTVNTFRNLASVRDDRTFDTAGLKQDWSVNLSPNHLVRFGFDLKNVGASYDYSGQASVVDPFLRDLSPEPVRNTVFQLSPSGTETSLYVSERMKLGAHWAAELGLRWDRQSYVGEGDDQFSPRLNVVWNAGGKTSARAAWGDFYQSQAISELHVPDGETEFAPAEKSRQLLVGLRQELRAVAVTVDLYEKRFSDLRPRYENLFDPLELFPEVEFDRVRTAPESARARGAEVLVEHRNDERLQWWISYAKSRATDRIDGDEVLRGWDQEDAVNFSVNLRRTPWNFNIGGAYHTGWPTTPIHGVIETREDGTQFVRPRLGERNSERLPLYHRIDVRATREVQVSRGSLRFFVEVFNILNRKNACCAGEFNITFIGDGTVDVEREPDDIVGWLPSFGLMWEF